jgi:L-asparaginase II
VADLYAGGEPLVELVRNDFVESRHSGSVVVLSPTGEAAAWAGDVQGAMFPRSSNKPLQAVGMLRAGLTLPPDQLALVAASHRGQPFHIDLVQRIMADGGLPLSTLACPADYPLADDARDDIVRGGGTRAPVLMNCSGKHAGMLRTCVAAGWPVDGYLDPRHPLQQRLTTEFAQLTGEPVVATGVDGCGAPVLSTSLRALALAFLRLAQAEPGTHEHSVAEAMRAHPELISGTDADGVDTHLMRAIPGLIAKSGAEGVIAVAGPELGAVALKIDDGALRARMPLLAAALRRIGCVLDQYAESPILGGGRQVGAVRAVW